MELVALEVFSLELELLDEFSLEVVLELVMLEVSSISSITELILTVCTSGVLSLAPHAVRLIVVIIAIIAIRILLVFMYISPFMAVFFKIRILFLHILNSLGLPMTIIPQKVRKSNTFG